MFRVNSPEATVSQAIRRLLVIGALAFPAGAMAQIPVNFGLAAGPTFSTDAEQTGWHAAGFIGMEFPFVPFGLRLDGMMNEWELEGTDADLRIWAVNGSVLYGVLPTPIIRPYVIGGLGFYSAKLDVSGATSENDIGFSAGAGMRFRAASLSFFAEARYHRLFNEADTDFIPVSLGLIF